MTCTKLGEMTEANKANNLQHFRSDLADVRIWIQINLEIRIRFPDHLFVDISALAEFAMSALVE